MNKQQIIKHILTETLNSFDEIKELKNTDRIDEIDFHYELTRDRKANLVLKSVFAEVNLINAMPKLADATKMIENENDDI